MSSIELPDQLQREPNMQELHSYQQQNQQEKSDHDSIKEMEYCTYNK
jgi:hypothetical protein